ncbi:3-mercaptopyruvate sulfurtransferase [Aestuariivirga litoralis]|uniref:3-mercaptopyruvate sulfurtransferase n=1 Tax=Aestuariivirga litoralis TaxID=2650924 RepID=UPI0018C71310|nr:3-mercaptopyruvate sulfurtransferase [Aestuariivirga litoralis]MBG1231333.1 3-mercaptopyruvate sulfurtransferase [Aestuariivirga litoralis]
MSNLVSTQWLADHLGDANLVILDASWHLPTAKRDAKAEFATGHIPGARFFDLDKTSDRNTTLPHMLPKAEDFAAAMSALGIGNDMHVVAYDSYGLFSAARCWWMFKVFGHTKVSVLDGGLKKWNAENRSLEIGETASVTPATFTATLNAGMVRNLKQVAATGDQIADARSGTRFRGEEQEPRPGVKPGHMPGAHNVHYSGMITEQGTLKQPSALREKFTANGVDLAKPIITSCGSGVTAAILTLALEELGVKDHALYDGSWAEWGASSEKIVTGP